MPEYIIDFTCPVTTDLKIGRCYDASIGEYVGETVVFAVRDVASITTDPRILRARVVEALPK